MMKLYYSPLILRGKLYILPQEIIPHNNMQKHLKSIFECMIVDCRLIYDGGKKSYNNNVKLMQILQNILH